MNIVKGASFTFATLLVPTAGSLSRYRASVRSAPVSHLFRFARIRLGEIYKFAFFKSLDYVLTDFRDLCY